MKKEKKRKESKLKFQKEQPTTMKTTIVITIIFMIINFTAAADRTTRWFYKYPNCTGVVEGVTELSWCTPRPCDPRDNTDASCNTPNPPNGVTEYNFEDTECRRRQTLPSEIWTLRDECVRSISFSRIYSCNGTHVTSQTWPGASSCSGRVTIDVFPVKECIPSRYGPSRVFIC